MGHGVLDETDPLFVPLGLAHRMWADVDLVLGIGSRIEFPLLQWGTTGVNLIQINTDHDELDRHGIGALGIHGDAAEVVPLLLDRLGDLQRPDRRAELRARRDEFFNDIADLEPQLSYLAAIRDALPDDAILVEDVTQMTFVAHFAYQFTQPRTFLSTGFAGTLGSGVAAGIGAKAGAPDRTVVTITGDGGFLFTATELASAVQHRHSGDHGRVQRQRVRQRASDPAGAVRARANDRLDLGQSRHRRVRGELRLPRAAGRRSARARRCAAHGDGT